MGFILGEIDRAADVLNLTDGYAAVKQRSDAAQRVLAHTVAEQVGARIDEDRTADTVLPVVVMREAAGGSLNPADDDRHITIGLTDAVTIDDHSAVGPLACLAACRIPVVAAALFRRRIVRNHRIDIARVDEKAQPRTAERGERRTGAPIGLRQNRHTKARRFKHAGNDRRAERRMIDVCVAGDKHEVGRIPAARLHILTADRQKAHDDAAPF